MAMRLVQLHVLMTLILLLATSKLALASDPDIISDFIVPKNYNTTTNIDANIFTHTGLRGIFDHVPETFKATKASVCEFPALNGQSVSYAVLQFPPNSLFQPHTRPDSTGLMLVVDGFLEVGLMTPKTFSYTQKLQAGDMFVFPKGLVHYQYNSHPELPAPAIAAFGSASARAVAVLPSIFATGIDGAILAKAFQTDVDTIKKIKDGFTTGSIK